MPNSWHLVESSVTPSEESIITAIANTIATIITHTWTEGGREKSKTVRLSGPGQYEIVAERNPTDVSIEMSVPSGGK